MKLKQLLLFMLCIGALSCTSESTDPPPNKETTEENTDSTLIKKIVYNEGTADEYSETYNYDGNKLLNIDYGDGFKNVYTYDVNDNLIKDDFYEGNVITASIVLEYDTNNKLTKFTENFLEGSGLEDRKNQHIYTYNNDASVTCEVYSDFNNSGYELNYTETFSFNGKNIAEIDQDNSTNGNINFKTLYDYDDKNGIFKNIHAVEILNILSENEFGALIYGNTNNITSYTESDSSITDNYYNTYVYTYNEKNYPTTCVYTSKYGEEDDDVETINFYYE